MRKSRLILYSGEVRNCSCYNTFFKTEFETVATTSDVEFLKGIRNFKPEAAILCFCSGQNQQIEPLLRLNALSGPILILTCCKSLNPEFVQYAAQEGVDRFLLCGMKLEKIQDLIYEAIRNGGLKVFLESCFPGSLVASPHISKMAKEIVHTFPQRLQENEMAQRLGISRSWLHKLCRQTFAIAYSTLIRRIWVHQALCMMKHTGLDNGDIALQLCYSEESNMARDFRKELGYSPTEARKRLSSKNPVDILL